MKPFFLSIALFFLCQFALAQVRLPRLVRDSMVLQRDARINIWGWATAGEKISIRFNNKTYKTTTGKEGKWAVRLVPMKAGGPYTMNIEGRNRIDLKDILVGDVWLCSGQSNMVHQMELHHVLYSEDISKAAYPQIRHFFVPNITNIAAPQDDLPGGFWKQANPKDVREFSAVAYFFARKLYEKYNVPIGLINASWGGTPIEAWMSEEGFKDFHSILSTVQKNKDTAYVNSVNRRASAAARPPRLQDRGMAESWFSSSYVPKGWRTINIPGYWEDQGIKDLDGVVWYRREIDIPASMTTGTAKVFLGRIVDADMLYINGKQVGTTTYMYPQRRYNLPAGILKTGKNLFVVRVTNNAGKGGFVPDKPYQLIAGKDTIDLKGYWQYKVGQVNIPQRGFSGSGIALQNQPTALYNSMLAPLVNFNVKGFLWYQGESNTGRADEYAKLQPAMIADWRQKWNNSNAPFLYVQLPGFMEMNYLPTESQWAQFREAQRKSLSVPNTAMAVAIDLGEWNDIHPDRKKEVGERLALAAENIAYGDKTVVYSGPLYQSAAINGNKIILSFTNTGSGLVANDGEELSEFAIAGADKKFVWAKAKIEGDKVVVWNDDVGNPVYVRYAWADNPVNPNLFNNEGLPASPFEASVTGHTASTQGNNLPWNNKRSAVVLTYDDGLNVHLSNAVPALDSFGFKGTFYISDHFGGLQAQIPKWKIAAMNGHELANHTVYHPCEGGRAGREFVKPDYDLKNYTVKRITDEMKTMNTLLKAMDGKSTRTFAFPCNDTKIHDTAYIKYAKDDFIAARAVRSEMPEIEKVDLYDLPSYVINGQSGEELISLVKKAMAENKLLVFLFHGVGGEHSLNVSLDAHHQLLQFLKENEKDIWVAPMVDVAAFVKDYQSKKRI